MLLLGESGSGKSDLALRLIHAGATLIGDDQVELTRRGAGLSVSPVASLKGLLEVFGLGIIEMPYVRSSTVKLCVELVGRESIERLPLPQKIRMHGVSLPLLKLHAFDVSAVEKIFSAWKALHGGTMKSGSFIT